MPGFTPSQGKYLSFIHAYTVGVGLPPEVAEIALAFGVSGPSVNRMLTTLVSKGLIHREPGVARTIKILVDESIIPKWTGHSISDVVTKMVVTKPRSRSSCVAESLVASDNKSTNIYVFKITLLCSKPSIWRRIETVDVTLAKLHELFQAAMGWSNSHLHQFRISGRCYTDLRGIESGMEWGIPYTGMTIATLVAHYGPKFKLSYEYDLGDRWEHYVSLEKIIMPAARVAYPRCTGGKLACPPEDVGGIWGFYDFVDAVKDPAHPQHEDKLECYGPFDAADFDKHEATARMKKVIRLDDLS